MHWYTIPQDFDGHLLRAFLQEKVGLSHRCLSQLKRRENGILLNGVRVTVRAVLHGGDVLMLHTEDEEGAKAPTLLPVDLVVPILYEDEDICLCHKPYDMPTHPSFGHHTDTLANALAYRYRGAPFVFRVITRLDRQTDGVVLVARNAMAAATLGRAMQQGRITKQYLALVRGCPPTQGRIDLPIRRVKGSVMLREVTESSEGDAALTLFERLATDGETSLVKVMPKTGRTHQIRVHFAALGHPLLGDELYGDGKGGFSRTALHAHRLQFSHPCTGEKMDVCCPLLPDMAEVVSRLLGGDATQIF